MKYFYECGGCDCYHPFGWIGDCRDDRNRYSLDDFGNMVNYFNEGFKLWDYQIVGEDFDGDESKLPGGLNEVTI